MMPKNTAHMTTIHCMPSSQCISCERFSPSEILRATNFRTSSSSTTGTENFITVTHSSTDSGVTWNTACEHTSVTCLPRPRLCHRGYETVYSPTAPRRTRWRNEGWRREPWSPPATCWTRVAWSRATGSQTNCSWRSTFQLLLIRTRPWS